MSRIYLILAMIGSYAHICDAQITSPKFGDGIRITAADSSFYMRAGFRFQTLYTGEWRKNEGESSFNLESHSFLIRRSRLKFDGWVLSPRVAFKAEIALTNRDQSGGNATEFRNAPNTVLDASIAYKFSKGFSVQFGQRKLPGNRERVISSGNLQLVDRSLVNSRYNIDRDVGLQFKTNHHLGGQVYMNETFAISQGEGRNVTAGNFGGLSYAARAEIFPFGLFGKKGDYVGGATYQEETPKLSIGASYELNKNAVRERGQLGSFIQSEDGTYFGRDLNTFFIDAILKYQGFSLMVEYANKNAAGDDPFVFDDEDNLIGTFFTGTGFNLVVGHHFDKNYELTVRYTTINPMESVANDEEEYTFGFSKYFVKHKLKIQTDLVFRNTIDSNNKIFYRFQTDLHF